ncbi:MAG: glycosyltransferase 87 family protein [Oryzihumus sp.]
MSSERLETLRRAFWVALVPGAALFLVMQVWVHVHGGMLGADSHAYWLAARDPQFWYTRPPAYRDAYLYSPAFAQLLWPLGQLPWRGFEVVWAAGQVALLTWLLAPLGWRRGLTLAPFLVAELLLGNVYVFLAGALVLSLRRAPGALALPLLTKVAPGVVGVWFVARREWRAVLQAAAATAAIALVSVALAPHAWLDWVQFLARTAGGHGGSVGLRLLVALGVCLFAARGGRAWLLAPALILACPVIGGYGPLAVLAAVPRLLRVQAAPVLSRRRARGVAAPDLVPVPPRNLA